VTGTGMRRRDYSRVPRQASGVNRKTAPDQRLVIPGGSSPDWGPAKP